MTNTFHIAGRFQAAPPHEHWRGELAQRLGSRPRRIGLWSELALYGALACLDDAHEYQLPHDASILVASRHGPVEATRAVLDQGREDLPMPLTFLQTQPSQMLAVLAAHLRWRGDACFINACNLLEVLSLAAVRSGEAGLLLGWVDEIGGGRTSWLRLRPASGVDDDIQAGTVEELFSVQTARLRIQPSGLEILTG